MENTDTSNFQQHFLWSCRQLVVITLLLSICIQTIVGRCVLSLIKYKNNCKLSVDDMLVILYGLITFFTVFMWKRTNLIYYINITIIFIFRFLVQYVLSEPNSKWKGLTGRFTSIILEEAISRHIKDSIYTKRDIFFAICGPTAFINLTQSLLKEEGITNQQIFSFIG